MASGAWLDLDDGIADEFGEVQRLSPFAFDRDELRDFRVVYANAGHDDEDDGEAAPCSSRGLREAAEDERIRVNERRRARRLANLNEARAKDAEKALRWWHAHKDQANERRAVLGRLRREQAVVASGQLSLVLVPDAGESGERLTSGASSKGEGPNMRQAS